ncbi:tRNA 2-thiouridine(34) synthase MnmA [Thermotoga sp. RQ2]|uniref:tRNA-specific 2-thiouridylase MnmA n=1 Tax=Thermotoga sp. (strain RQ2) TaxID=126740 RepID=MNMA_THESQ|nr:tRNA 2-thiouridine(34) synthase MnmA [Thermotoga sp. RQ2]B1L8X5.1 RecName: Full=tRNA-specific 2-thiouridylase MnmA [Thermotoga sp. RQ2]ACB08773.1 tRNA (5-methylaminomethyl-2-thiouridylate)-methyltransferase [Thermotoga sp. RQ2]
MKVGVALSGGVDSAVALYLLLKEGHEVKAFHMKTKEDEFFLKKEIKKKVCCSPSDTADAIRIARSLGVEIEIVDVREVFREKVIEPFKRDLLRGLTPNPCVHCNRYVKFGYFMDYVLSQGFDAFASGHYARVEFSGKYGKKVIKKGVDGKKDQSYFLARIEPWRIEKLLFPNGIYTKEEIRRIAEEAGIHVAKKQESQDVCFIPDGSIENFLKDEGITLSEGKVITEKGEVVGHHRGYPLYTVGQRKGLKIEKFGERLYVREKIPESNVVVVSGLEDVFFSGLIAEDPVWHVEVPEEFRCVCRVRKKSEEAPAVVRVRDNEVEVRFEKKVFAVTPGQIAAFYDEDTLLGGAIIKEGIR